MLVPVNKTRDQIERVLGGSCNNFRDLTGRPVALARLVDYIEQAKLGLVVLSKTLAQEHPTRAYHLSRLLGFSLQETEIALAQAS